MSTETLASSPVSARRRTDEALISIQLATDIQHGCVQAEATQPLVHAFDNGLDDTIPADAGQTLAYGLNVPGGRRP